MSLLKKLASQTAIYGISSIAGRALNFLLLPLHTRAFPDQSEYGIISDLYAVTGLLTVLFIYRMETAFFRYGHEPERREAAFSTALWSVTGSTLALSALILIFAPTLTRWMAYPPEQSIFITIFGLILAFDTLAEIPLARLRLENKPLRFAAVRLFGIGLNVVGNLFFLLLCPWVMKQGSGHFLYEFVDSIYRPAFGVGYVFLCNLIASAGSLLLLSPAFLRLKFEFDWRLWRTMFAYAAPLVIAGFAGIADEMLDRSLLKYLLPGTPKENLAQVGIYSACAKLAVIMSLFTQAFRYAAEPFFFAQSKSKDAHLLYGQVTKYFTIAGALAFLVVSLYLDFFKGFIDENYWGGLGVVPVLLLSSLLLGIYYNVSIWYKLTDQTMLGAWIAVGGTVLAIALNVWWIPVFGYTGSAWAKLVCYVAISIACVSYGQKYYPVRYDWKRMGMYVGLAIGLYFLGSISKEWTGMRQAVSYLWSALLVGAFCFFVWKMERGDLN